MYEIRSTGYNTGIETVKLPLEAGSDPDLKLQKKVGCITILPDN